MTPVTDGKGEGDDRRGGDERGEGKGGDRCV